MGSDGRLLFDEQARATRRSTQVAAGACLLAVVFMGLGLGESLQLRVQDLWLAVRGSRPASPQVAIVAIDGRALNAATDRWPWPRNVYVPLVEKLHAAGAKVIAFDIGFSKTTEQDDAFAAAMQKAGNVVFGVVFNGAGDRSPPGSKPPAYVQSHAVPRFDAPFLSVIPAPGIEPPAPQLAQSAAGVGHVVLLPSSDGNLRKLPTIIRHGDDVYPSLALQVARIYADVPLDAVQVTDTYVRVGYADVPIMQSGEALINWPTSDLNVAFPTYSAVDVLRGDVGRNELAGKAILVGMTAEGLDDRHFPFGMTLPGVILHAAFLDNFFTLNFLKSPGWAMALEWGALLGLAVLALFFPRLPTPALLVVAPTLMLSVLGLSLYLFIMRSVWWPPLYPMLAVAFPFATSLFFKLRSAEKETKVERARVREAESMAAEAVLEKGLAFQEKGSLELASATFAKLPMTEEMKTIYLNLGFDFQNRGKLDQALDCYQRVYKRDHGFADVAARIEALQAAGVGTQFAPSAVTQPLFENALANRSQSERTTHSPLHPVPTVVPPQASEMATGWTADDVGDATVAATVPAPLPPRPPATRVRPDSNALQAPPGGPASRYRMIERLGKGAMGEVSLMLDSKLERKVAIKMMRPDVGRSSRDSIELRHRFVREAKTAGKLAHPNIVTIYDSFEGEDGVAYIVMEYVEGRTLTSYIEGGVLSVPQIKHFIICTLDGLQYAHDNGVFHRDIKPDNIMISQKTGVVKIMDFGIARVVESEMTAVGSVLGTPSYMSPEQMSGEKVDGRSDVFSLGVVLFQLLVGTCPFKGGNLSEIMMAILQKDPPAPSTVDPARNVSAEWDPIVLKALSKDASTRYQSAAEFADAVRISRAT